MEKRVLLFLCVFLAISFSKANAQLWPPDTTIANLADSFSALTRNEAWAVTRYFISSDQIDKGSSFRNYTFRFDQTDSSKFSIEGISNVLKGQWSTEDNNKIIFSMPLVTKDSSNSMNTGDSIYNEVAKSLSIGPWKYVEIKSSILAFKILDALGGEISIEFKRKQ